MAEQTPSGTIGKMYESLSLRVQREREAKILFGKKPSLSMLAGFFLADILTKDRAQLLYENLTDLLSKKYRAFPQATARVVDDGYISSSFDFPIVTWSWPPAISGLKNTNQLPLVEEYEGQLLREASVTLGIEISQVRLVEARRFFKRNVSRFQFNDLREDAFYNVIGTFNFTPAFAGSDRLAPGFITTIRELLQPRPLTTANLLSHK